MFDPEPVAGVDLYRRQQPDAGLLAWRPQFAFVASSGDLGYDFGPYEYGTRGAAPRAFGHFLTVWRRAASERGSAEWKVVVDAGTPHAQEAAADGTTAVAAPAAAAAAPATPSAVVSQPARGSIARAERRLAIDAWQAGYERAIDARLRPDGIRLRAGHAPLMAGDSSLPEAEHCRRVRATVGGAGTSRANDLAYAYGILVAPDTGKRWAYLHVWRATGGAWRLALDRVAPVPAVPAVARRLTSCCAVRAA